MADNDSRLFKDGQKGELAAERMALRSKSDKEKVDAIKRIIFAMTNGYDVAEAFMDVVNNIQTKNTELKKLVYLYVMSYAKLQPELAISVVSTFQKDSQHASPLIRALAIRTMASIRVESVVEHLCEPLARTLTDEDAYVRKTAAIAVAKLHDMNASIVVDHGFLETLRTLLEDANSMVVSNALVALLEIQATSPTPVFNINVAALNKLLSALGECSEWGRVVILDTLAQYAPVGDARDAEQVIERVGAYLNHSNSAVILSAVRVIIKYMEAISAYEFQRATLKRIAQPLASLLNNTEKPPEIQYVALRNINLIVQRWPALFTTLQQVRLLFCNYNDPIYVKLEKIEILVRVATEANVDNLLLEFKTYAQEVDVEYVRKAVRAIGRCAIKLEMSTQKCIDVLIELIATKVNYVVQEAIVVIRDIFRKYPNRYEVVIGILCENLEELDEPDAKAAMIWIVGEYAERIENAAELLDSFMDTYADEVVDVQLALLTAIIKLFLKRPAETEDMVRSILDLVTRTAEDPDLRDRGYLYWRLLSANPEAAKAVVLAAKPLITDDAGNLDAPLLSTLLANVGTLSSVYYRPAEAFVVRTRVAVADDDADDEPPRPVAAAAAAALAAPAPAPAPAYTPVQQVSAQPAAPAKPATSGDLLDLAGLGGGGGGGGGGAVAKPAASVAPATGNLLDLLGGGVSTTAAPGAVAAPAAAPAAAAAAPAAPYAQPPALVIPAASAKGMQVSACLRRQAGTIVLHMLFENKTLEPLSDFQVAFNKNSFGLVPAGPVTLGPLGSNASGAVAMPVGIGAEMVLSDPLLALQVAVKSNRGVSFFTILVPFGCVLVESGRLARNDLLTAWRAIPEAQEVVAQLTLPATPLTLRSLSALLEANNIFEIASHAGVVPNQTLLFTSAQTTNKIVVMSELTVVAAAPDGPLSAVRIATRVIHPMVIAAYHAFLATLLASVG